MLHRAHGGVLAMQVLQISGEAEKEGWISKSTPASEEPGLVVPLQGGLRMFHPLNVSRTASPSVAFAALEMLGALCVGYVIFARRARPSGKPLLLPLASDNQGKHLWAVE